MHSRVLATSTMIVLGAAHALAQHTQFNARQIATEAMDIASKVCIYTNNSITVEEL